MAKLPNPGHTEFLMPKCFVDPNKNIFCWLTPSSYYWQHSLFPKIIFCSKCRISCLVDIDWDFFLFYCYVTFYNDGIRLQTHDLTIRRRHVLTTVPPELKQCLWRSWQVGISSLVGTQAPDRPRPLICAQMISEFCIYLKPTEHFTNKDSKCFVLMAHSRTLFSLF